MSADRTRKPTKRPGRIRKVPLAVQFHELLSVVNSLTLFPQDLRAVAERVQRLEETTADKGEMVAMSERIDWHHVRLREVETKLHSLGKAHDSVASVAVNHAQRIGVLEQSHERRGEPDKPERMQFPLPVKLLVGGQWFGVQDVQRLIQQRDTALRHLADLRGVVMRQGISNDVAHDVRHAQQESIAGAASTGEILRNGAAGSAL